jgi:hypothetical protein
MDGLIDNIPIDKLSSESVQTMIHNYSGWFFLLLSIFAGIYFLKGIVIPLLFPKRLSPIQSELIEVSKVTNKNIATNNELMRELVTERRAMVQAYDKQAGAFDGMQTTLRETSETNREVRRGMNEVRRGMKEITEYWIKRNGDLDKWDGKTERRKGCLKK